MTKDAEKYYREIRTLLPSKCDCGKSVVKSIKIRITEIESATPNVTYEGLCETLGDPKTVIDNYYNIVNVDDLVKELRSAKKIRACSYIALVAVIAYSFTVTAYYHQTYAAANHSLIQYCTEEIINE